MTATLLTLLVAAAAAILVVREARTELVLEPIDVHADPTRLRERGTRVDGMFEFSWSFPVSSNHLELSCSILRRCSGGTDLDYEVLEDHDLSIERYADGTFVARWIEDDEARTEGISRERIPRCAVLRVVERPRRPWRSAAATTTASVVLLAWLLTLRAIRALRRKLDEPLAERTQVVDPVAPASPSSAYRAAAVFVDPVRAKQEAIRRAGVVAAAAFIVSIASSIAGATILGMVWSLQ